MSKFSNAPFSDAAVAHENGTGLSMDSIRDSSIGRTAPSHDIPLSTTIPHFQPSQPLHHEPTSPISPVSDLDSDNPPPPSTDAIDQVIASAMALANSVHVIPKSTYESGRSINHPSPFQTLNITQQQHRRSITPSGFHPAAVGLDGRVNLFVGNLPYRVRWQDVKDLFRRAGTVLRADVSLDVATNRSRGYGTVLMGSREDGVKAIEMFNGYNWQTRTLEVRPDRLPPEYEPQPHVSGSHHPPSHQQQSQQFSHPQGGPMHPMPFSMGYGGPGPFGGGMSQMGPFHNALGGPGSISYGSGHAPGLGPGQGQSGPSYSGMWQGPGNQTLSPATSHTSPRHVGQTPYAGSVPPQSERSNSPVPYSQVPLMGEKDGRSFMMGNGRLSLGSREDMARVAPRDFAGGEPASSLVAGKIDTRRSSAADLLGGWFNPADTRQAPPSGTNGLHSVLDNTSMDRRTSLVDPSVIEPPFSLHRALGETVAPPRPMSLEDAHGHLGGPMGDTFDERHPPRSGFSDAHPFDGQSGRFEFDASMIPPGNHGGRLLMIGNLPYSVQWQELKDLFRTVGHVLRADIPTGPDKRSRGFGTILYASEYDAESAVMKFDGMEYAGRVLLVRQERNLHGLHPARNHREQVETNFAPPLQAQFVPPFGPPSHPTSPMGHRMPLFPPPSNEMLSYPAPHSISRNFGMNTEATSVSQSGTAGTLEGMQHLNDVDQDAQAVKGDPDRPTQESGAAGAPLDLQPNRTAPQRTNGAPHPGRIIMPSFTQFSNNALSPLQTRGLPPMTPSMPGFTFHAYPSTPPLHPMSYLSPGIGPFSPGLPYNGPPVFNFNPYMDPAPGAPVNTVPQNHQENGNGYLPEGDRPSTGSDKPDYFPTMSENKPEEADSLAQPRGSVGKSSGDDSVVDHMYDALQAIEDKVKGLDVSDEMPAQGATSNRASFDASKTGGNLVASIFNDQRRASMDDAKRKASE